MMTKSIRTIAKEHGITLAGRCLRKKDDLDSRSYDFDNVSVIVDRKNGWATFWGDLDNDGCDGVVTVKI